MSRWQAGDQAGDGAERRAAPPGQGADEGRTELRDASEGQNADRGEMGLADEAVVEIGQQRGRPRIAARRTRRISRPASPSTEAPRAAAEPAARAQQQRQDEIVRGHDRQRDRFDHHHGGGRRKAADHRDEGHRPVAGGERQSHHGDVAVDRMGKLEQAGDGERNDEEIDRQQIERKDDRRGLDVVFAVVLDDGDMELPGQEQHGAAGKQDQRGPDRGIGRGEDRAT